MLIKPITWYQLAAVHVYVKEPNPQRDFMSKAISDNKETLDKLIKSLAKSVVEGKMIKPVALGLVGQKLKDFMIKAINSASLQLSQARYQSNGKVLANL